MVLNMSSACNSGNITLIHKFATEFLQHFFFHWYIEFTS
jgi:hypothetical protein